MAPLSRRGFLASGAAAAVGSGWSRRAHATARSDLRFVFVRIFGGWDTTRVFAGDLSNPQVDYEDLSETGSLGDLHFVDHPERPGVRSFFETWQDRTVIVNGLVVPSVNHRICERLALTGGNAEANADWPTEIAHAQADRYSLPHVVAGGRSIPGQLGGSLVRVGDSGEVRQLLDGSVVALSDQPVAPADARVSTLIDAATRTATQLRTGGAGRRATLHRAYEQVLRRAEIMKDIGDAVRWDTAGTFSGQIDCAADVLSLGLSRCVTLSFDRLTWDSHEANDSKQHANFVDLFDGLHLLMDTLAATPGPVSASLVDDVVVVVISEMGRTPQRNAAKGKDHWAHTSALLLGPGLHGGRTVGGYDELFYGQTLDLDAAAVSASGRELTPELFGATLLELADVGPLGRLSEYSPIHGILS